GPHRPGDQAHQRARAPFRAAAAEAAAREHAGRAAPTRCGGLAERSGGQSGPRRRGGPHPGAGRRSAREPGLLRGTRPMSDFAGNEELLQDFLTEANELLADLDNRLVDLEKSPEQAALLNAVFRNFHTIKGGAGFLGATELVKLCHLTENLFDRLRNGQLALEPRLMDVLLAATPEVRTRFGTLAALHHPVPSRAKRLPPL